MIISEVYLINYSTLISKPYFKFYLFTWFIFFNLIVNEGINIIRPKFPPSFSGIAMDKIFVSRGFGGQQPHPTPPQKLSTYFNYGAVILILLYVLEFNTSGSIKYTLTLLHNIKIIINTFSPKRYLFTRMKKSILRINR